MVVTEMSWTASIAQQAFTHKITITKLYFGQSVHTAMMRLLLVVLLVHAVQQDDITTPLQRHVRIALQGPTKVARALKSVYPVKLRL